MPFYRKNFYRKASTGLITKSDISKEFSKLREYGFEVYNFSSNRALPQSAKGFVDIVIVKFKIVFIEIKMLNTNDKFSPEQTTLKNLLKVISMLTKYVEYHVINENNYNDLYMKLLKNLE